MKMISSTLGSLAALLTIASVVAAADVPRCLDVQTQWAYNSLGQSPCDMASYLRGVCSTTGTNDDIPALGEDYYYIVGSPRLATACRCNTVVYSLLSVCAICQDTGAKISHWSKYSQNCSSSVTSLGAFPANIPSGTKIPHWAYLDVATLDIFSLALAQDSLNAPESTPVLQETSASIPSHTFTSTSGTPIVTSPVQDGGSSESNAGPIAGGVIGGLAFLAIVGGLAFWLVRRRRKTLGGPTMAPASTSPPTSQYVDYNPVSMYSTASPSLQKPYDPSDPLTFPSPYSQGSLPYQAGTPPPGSTPTPNLAPAQLPPQGPNGYSSTGQGHGYAGVPEL